jgi:DNA-binding beta-propeller fold protein YncE
MLRECQLAKVPILTAALVLASLTVGSAGTPAKPYLYPGYIELRPGITQPFQAYGVDPDGEETPLTGPVKWTADPGAGSITPEGVFTSAAKPGYYPNAVQAALPDGRRAYAIVKVVDAEPEGGFIREKTWGRLAPEQVEPIESVALDPQGHIFLAQAEHSRITEFDSDGNYITSWAAPERSDVFGAPGHIAFDPQGDVYVVSDHVRKFDRFRKLVAKWGDGINGVGRLRNPGPLAIAPDGSVYIADVYPPGIAKFDGKGTFLTRWGTQGTGKGQFTIIRDIAADSKGNVYVIDGDRDAPPPFHNRVQEFDASGKFLTSWNLATEGNVDQALGVTVGPGDYLYVTDTNPGSATDAAARHVLRFDPTGALIASWGTDDVSPYSEKVLVDPRGGFLISDGSNLLRFDASMTYLETPIPYGDLRGRYHAISGLVMDGAGNLLVTDGATGMVDRLDPSGRFLDRWETVSPEAEGGELPGAFYDPQGPGNPVADSEGRVFVLDGSDGCVRVSDREGKLLASFGKHDVSDSFVGLALAPDGSVYVAADDFITKFVPAAGGAPEPPRPALQQIYIVPGNLSLQQGVKQQFRALGLDADGHGFVTGPVTWSADPRAGAITQDGVFAPTGGPGTYFRAVHAEAAGGIRSDAMVTILSPTPQGGYLLERKWGRAGPYAISSTRGLALDSEGNTCFADLHDRVAKLDPSGRLLRQWGSPGRGEGEFSWLGPLALDPQGNVYVVDQQSVPEDGDWNTWVAAGRIQKFDPEGRFLTAWGSRGTGKGQFQGVESIAVDASGCLYALDAGNNRVQKFDSEGRWLLAWGSKGRGQGEFDRPSRLWLDPDGSVLVADSDNERVEKFDPSGRYLAEWPLDRYREDHDSRLAPPAKDSAGNTIDSNGVTIRKVDPAGRVIWEIGHPSEQGVLLRTSGISVDADGSVYLTDEANEEMAAFGPDGGLLSPPAAVLGAHKTSVDVAIDAEGSRYIADDGECQVRKQNPAGQTIATWGEPGTGPGQFDRAVAVAVDAKGFVYVADHENHRIQKFTASGTFVTMWGTRGSGPGQFVYPLPIAFDRQGNVYVGDMDNNRVQKFTSDGTYLTEWGGVAQASALAVDAQGSVYGADGVTGEVLKFVPSPQPSRPR